VLNRIFRKDIVIRSLYISAIVGTMLNLINQGDKLITGSEIDVLKCLLTYLVPYCVATYSAAMVISK